MKNFKSKILSFSLILLLSLTIIKCKRNVQIDVINNTNSYKLLTELNEISLIRPTFLPLFDKKLNKKELEFKKYKNNSTYVANFTSLSTSELTKFLKNLTTYDLEPVGAVFYLNKLIDSQQIISDEDITAISFYSYNDGKIFHKIYIKSGEKYISKVDYEFETSLSTANHMTFVLKNILPKELNSISYLCINSTNFQNKITSKIDYFLIKESAYYKNWLSSLPKNKNSLFKAPPTGGGGTGNNGCGTAAGCTSSLPWDLCLYDPFVGFYLCGESPICTDNLTYNILSNSGNYSQNDINNAYQFNLHYKLRDSILLGSYIGEKYISYYYSISNAINGNINLGLALNCFQVLPKMNVIITQLLEPVGHENEILIDDNYYVELNDIINDLKEISDEESFVEILDDLKNDLDYYHGKTLSAILTVL